METYSEFIQRMKIEGPGHKIPGETECHHIIPKCMGGTNEKDNMIHLYYKDHVTAHKLLAMEHPDVVGLQYAYHYIVNTRDGYTSLEDIEFLKRECHSKMRGENNPMYGKHHSEESNLKRKQSLAKNAKIRGERISKAHAGVKLSPEHCQAISDSHKGKPKSEAHKKALSESRINSGISKGANNPRAKAVQNIETGKVFYTANEAGIWAGYSPDKCPGTHIIAHIRHPEQHHTAGKHPETGERLHWKFLESVETAGSDE